jgi:hypothetical protein
MSNTLSQNFVVSPKRVWILIALVLLTVLLRVRDLNFLWNGTFLWAEDGNIFINEASSLGLASLWKPYAGYLHLYPRLIAYVFSGIELGIRPVFMLLAWLAAYLSMFYVLIRYSIDSGFRFTSLIFLILLVSLQPNNGEVFFNITNAHWFLGIMLLLFISEDKTYSPYVMPGWLLLGLTGPFVIIFLPILLLRVIFLKDVNSNRVLYLSLIGCAAIQIYFLLNSGRVTAETSAASLVMFGSALYKMLFLGAKDWIFALIAAIFWAGIAVCVLSMLKAKVGNTLNVKIILLVVGATLSYLAAIYSFKANPLIITPDGGGNRYTWIPFTILFFYGLWVSRNKLSAQIVIFLMGFVICADSFRQIRLVDLQFPSFAHFSHYKSIAIPINPVWDKYPSWHVNAEFPKDDMAGLVSHTVTWHRVGISNEPVFEFLKPDEALFSINKPNCHNAPTVAVEINAIKHNAGWVNLLWKNNGDSALWSELKRWYPEGNVIMQFAFPYSEEGAEIRLILANYFATDDRFLETKVYCLP